MTCKDITIYFIFEINTVFFVLLPQIKTEIVWKKRIQTLHYG